MKDTGNHWEEKFKKMTKEEFQQYRCHYLQKELHTYEEQVPMTLSERKELRKWVRHGNSIYANPWNAAYENGHEMNYLDALKMDY